MSDVCVCIRDVISECNTEIEGSLAFCALMLFMCSILCHMCSGSSVHVECMLPFGMSNVVVILFTVDGPVYSEDYDCIEYEFILKRQFVHF